jgi:hypothetical protein
VGKEPWKILEAHGIPCRIEPSDSASRRAPRYAVCVAEEDLDRALALNKEYLLKQMPDAASLIEFSSEEYCPAATLNSRLMDLSAQVVASGARKVIKIQSRERRTLCVKEVHSLRKKRYESESEVRVAAA